MTTETLIPGSNFKIKSLNNIRFNLPDGSGYVLGSGWGLWDLTAQGWVRLGGFFSTPQGDFPAPYCPIGGRSALKEILKSGLYDGYEVIFDNGAA